MLTLEEFDKAIRKDGWALLESVVPERIIWEMSEDLDFAYASCRRAQKEGGLADVTEGTVHHLPAVRGRSFLRFLESNPAAPYISRFFGGKPYILQSFGGNFNFPDAGNYAGRVHRDIRSFWNDRLMLNTLVTLDDMNAENGATWLLPGGHEMEERPADEVFDSCAVQVTAARSILLWDSRLWHRAGVNRSKAPRRIVTPIFTLPFYKSGFDYCRGLGYERVAEMSPQLQQVLGYLSRVPASLDEWYRKPEERLYQGSQG